MEDEKMMSFFRFEDLRIYDKVLSYIEFVHNTTMAMPDSGNAAEIARRFFNASQSIAVAIAEGSGRSKPQFVQLLKEARASVRECLVMGTISGRLLFLSEQQVEENREMIMEISKMLGALITSLQKTTRKSEPRHEYEEERYHN